MTRSEEIAQEFHDTLERLSPGRSGPPLPWAQLPVEKRALWVAVVNDLRSRAVIG